MHENESVKRKNKERWEVAEKNTQVSSKIKVQKLNTWNGAFNKGIRV
jgi:hypothetical protein